MREVHECTVGDNHFETLASTAGIAICLLQVHVCLRKRLDPEHETLLNRIQTELRLGQGPRRVTKRLLPVSLSCLLLKHTVTHDPVRLPRFPQTTTATPS